MTGKLPIFENVLVQLYDQVGVIILNRPQVHNALSQGMMEDLKKALDLFEKNPSVGAMVLTGTSKCFAAGADIKEMADKTFTEAYLEDFITQGWEWVSRCRKPILAAVSGYALGGGLELALMCDFIVATKSALFGQPEVTLGIMPGAGGTQRLCRLIGKAKTMDLCLTGRTMDAEEAERLGLVSRLLPQENFIDEAVTIAHHMAGMPRLSSMLIKEAVNAAYETSLQEGIHLERRLFHATFSTEDQKEGMTAFLEKRVAHFKKFPPKKTP